MEVKFRRLLEELVDSGLCNEFEQNAFKDMVDRDDRGKIDSLTEKQGAWIERSAKKYFEGIEDDNQTANEPTEYDNCKLVFDKNGCHILVGEDRVRVEISVSKADGKAILRWLHPALKQLNFSTGENHQDKVPEETPVKEDYLEKYEKVDDLPIDDPAMTFPPEPENEEEEDPF